MEDYDNRESLMRSMSQPLNNDTDDGQDIDGIQYWQSDVKDVSIEVDLVD